MTYAEHKAWLERERDGFNAELTGFISAACFDAAPAFYEQTRLLRQRFELGFANGKTLLAQEQTGSAACP